MSATASEPLAAHRALVAALRDPRCYPHPVEAVRVIETHISSVLLTGPYAYKLKKPVDTGFLDYTTLAARRHFCLEELRLNARLAPRLYLEVVPIGGTASAPSVGQAHDVIDYAVKMREFSQDDLLDRLLAAGALDARHIDALAAKVAAFHASVDRVRDGRGPGSAADVAAPVRRCIATLRQLVAPAERDAVDAVARWMDARHGELAALIDARHRDGWVRECHGDLHLGNVALVDGALEIFDCIEFDPALRWIDVQCEVAFLAMDLDARGRPDYAARFVNGWLEASGDYGGTPLLRYYEIYRALVRAMVALLRAEQHPAGSPARRDAEEDHVRRLRLARALIAERRPALLLTRGVSGSGKTTLSQHILESLGAIRLRSDVERKRLHGMTAMARSDPAARPALYGEAATAATYGALCAFARTTLTAGFDTIVDATFLRRSLLAPFRDLAAELGVPFLILDCQAEPAVLRERVQRRQRAGADASEADVAVLEGQLRAVERLGAAEADVVLTVDTEREPAATTVARVRRRLGRG